MKNTTIIFLIFIFLTPVMSAQESDDYKHHDGYIDFGSFDRLQDAEKTVEVFIKGPLLDFVAKATENEDPDLALILKNLTLIKVNVFSLNESHSKEIYEIIDSVSKRIDRAKWELMIRRKESDEYVEVYAQFGKSNHLTGLVVMALEENDEAVFVNIVGNINPLKLGKLSRKFNIPKLDSLKTAAR